MNDENHGDSADDPLMSARALELQPELEVEVLDIDAGGFDEAVFAPRGLLVVVYFWGRNCPNCDYFKRHLPGLLLELRGAALRLVKINVYEHMSVATRFGLVGIPAFLLVRDGVRLGKMSEFYGAEAWLEVVREHLPGQRAE